MKKLIVDCLRLMAAVVIMSLAVSICRAEQAGVKVQAKIGVAVTSACPQGVCTSPTRIINTPRLPIAEVIHMRLVSIVHRQPVRRFTAAVVDRPRLFTRRGFR